VSQDRLETSLLLDVFALNQTMRRLLERAMRDGPLTPGEHAVYSAVFELESATPTALAARLGMRLTTLLDQLRQMEERGHARRMPNPHDRRARLVTLTAAGLEAHRAASQAFETAYATFLVELGGEVRPRQVLRSMREAAERAATTPSTNPRQSAARVG
jgi:DNA-binding MarR family transcriptional regulator